MNIYDEVYYSDYPDNKEYPYAVEYSYTWHGDYTNSYFLKTEESAREFAKDMVPEMVNEWERINRRQNHRHPIDIRFFGAGPCWISVKKYTQWNEEYGEYDVDAYEELAHYDINDTSLNYEYYLLKDESCLDYAIHSKDGSYSAWPDSDEEEFDEEKAALTKAAGLVSRYAHNSCRYCKNKHNVSVDKHRVYIDEDTFEQIDDYVKTVFSEKSV